MEWIYAAAALASGLSAALAWAAKLWWSKEFSKAKEEIIRAKEAQIELLNRELQGLREMTPMKIREYFLSVRQQLEEYIDTLNKQLGAAQKEIGEKNMHITSLQSEGQEKSTDIAKLKQERDAIQDAATGLKTQLAAYKRADLLIIDYKVPKIDMSIFQDLDASSNKLMKALSIKQDAVWKVESSKARDLMKALELHLLSPLAKRAETKGDDNDTNDKS